MAYTPNVYETTRPVDADIAETAQLEFRTMKAFFHGTVGRTAAQTIVNNAAALSIMSVTIPAGVMSTNKKVRARITGYLSNSTGGAAQSNIGISWGGTALVAYAVAAPANGQYAFRLDIDLFNKTAANVNAAFIESNTYGTDSVAGGMIAAISATAIHRDGLTIDTTLAQALSVSSQLSVASPNLAIVIAQAIMEWIN